MIPGGPENEEIDCEQRRDVANKKAQKTLDNPVLSVDGEVKLSPQREDQLKIIAKNAFDYVLDTCNFPCIKVTKRTQKRKLHFVKTTWLRKKTVKNVPGVYIIRDAVTGRVLVGSTSDIGTRLAQYPSRSKHPPDSVEARNNPINSNIRALVAKYRNEGIEFAAAFDRIAVWAVDSQPDQVNGLTPEQILEFKYLEGIMIEAAFNANIALNNSKPGNVVVNRSNSAVSSRPSDEGIESTRSKNLQRDVNLSLLKPLQTSDGVFKSLQDYVKFTFMETGTKKNTNFVRNSAHRNGQSDSHSLPRYLNTEQIQFANDHDLFMEVEKACVGATQIRERKISELKAIRSAWLEVNGGPNSPYEELRNRNAQRIIKLKRVMQSQNTPFSL